MRRSVPIGLLVGIFIVIAIVVSLRFVPPIDWQRFTSAERVRTAPVDVYASLDITYDHPPIFEEHYQMEDRNGASTFSYRILRAAGPRARVTTTIEAPPAATYTVSFFIGQLSTDGAWEVQTQPPRGDTSVHYTLTMRQTEDFQHVSHTVSFTDPHYWATTAGREFHIHLTPTGPLPNIVQLQGAGLRDPRYEKLVDDFRSFGPPQFRTAIARARAAAHD